MAQARLVQRVPLARVQCTYTRCSVLFLGESLAKIVFVRRLNESIVYELSSRRTWVYGLPPMQISLSY
jgi:hypothetical protein